MTSFNPIAYLNEPRWHKVSLGLERIAELLELLGNPQENLRFVHVAGTNGKGSTSAFIAQILQESGYNVGLFTSPYLIKFEERIQVNRQVIPYSDLVEVTLEVRDAAQKMSDAPTEFELMTAVAFLYFKKQQCDVVVAEVGLGGRLDSTNVITTVEASVITPIAFDHCAILGNTLGEIAFEKAGIIKRNVPVVSAPQKPEARKVIEKVASEKESTLFFADLPISGDNDSFSYGSEKDLSISLLGRYQRINASVALVCAKELKRRGWKIESASIRKALKKTQWPGRFERICEKPEMIIDGAHNKQGIDSLVETLKYRYSERPIVFLVGILADKNHEEMLQAIAPLGETFVTIPVGNPRALSSDALAQELREIVQEEGLSPDIYSAQTVEEGVSQAFSCISENGIICACGSLYSISDIEEAVKGFNKR